MLEFYRDAVLEFSQPDPLGDMHLRFVGESGYVPRFSDEYSGAVAASRDEAVTQ
jgi:hypothetical protein